jgi:flagellar motility protein MotE (MotC chaperone)
MKTRHRTGRLGLIIGVLILAKVAISAFYLGILPWPWPLTGEALAEDKEKTTPAADQRTLLQQLEQHLKEKEARLQKKEQELLPLKKEIDEKLAELEELQARLTAYAKELADREKALKDAKVAHLVALYKNMEPVKAAAIMEKLNMDTVVRILGNMKGKAAGQILAQMKPEKGALISEKLSRMQ